MNKFSMLKRNDVIWLIGAEQAEVLEIDNPKFYNEQDVKTRLIERTAWLTANAVELDVADTVSYTEAGNLMRIKHVRQAIEDWCSDIALELEAYANQIDDGDAHKVLFNIADLQGKGYSLFNEYNEILRPLIKYDPDLWDILYSQLQQLIKSYEQFIELAIYFETIGGK
jgi:hypothetical protein